MNYRKTIVRLMIVALVLGGIASTATAAVIGTPDALAMDRSGSRLASVQAGLVRADVQQAMIQLGVDPAQAQLRVAALSEPELARLQNELDQMPAGGILGLIGAVFVVLLILEITGVIDVFKKV